MDADQLAALFRVLAESLRSRPTAAPPAIQLGADLGRLVVLARTWAEQNGIPASCIPPTPGANPSSEAAARFLVDLAEAIRYLASASAPLVSMASVVGLLAARRACALTELRNLHTELTELLRDLVALEEALDERSASASNDSTEHTGDSIRQIVWRCRGLCRTIGAWHARDVVSEYPWS